MSRSRLLTITLTMSFALLGSMLVTGCSSSSGGSYRTHTNYGVGYRNHYRRPWGYPPVYIGGGGIGEVDPDWGVDAPVAVPMPEMGMPDFGGMDMGGMDFDW